MTKLLMVLIFTGLWGNAWARSGARGGGHVVQIGNKYKLYDEVTEAKCDWLTGKEILAENPYINSFFKKLAKLDWYLAFELRRETEYLAWCKTGKLYFHEPKDRDSVVQQEDTKPIEQAAYRYDSSVYLDHNIYRNMYERSRVYLILHEVLHSYLEMPTKNEVNTRYLQLISLVSTMKKVDLNQIVTREKLHFNLKSNEMIFPLFVKYLTPFKADISVLLDRDRVLRSYILSKNNPDDILGKNYDKIIPFLTSWDALELKKIKRKYLRVLKSIFEDEYLETFKFVLNKNFAILNPVSIAFSRYEFLDESKRSILFSPKYFNLLAKESISFFESIEVSLDSKTERFVANQSLQRISNLEKNKKTIYLSYLEEPARGSNYELPAEIVSSIYLMKHLADNRDFEKIRTLFGRGSYFYSLFTLEHVISDLEELTPAIEREKELAIRIVIALRSRLMENYFKEVKRIFVDDVSEHIIKILKIRS